MTVGTYTIGIPGGSASDFASTPIPSLVLSQWPQGTLPTRQEYGYSTLQGRSAHGTPLIEGPAYEVTYGWTIAAWLTGTQMLQLGALAKWQAAAYKAQQDGALRLIDEVRLLDPEPNPHSKTLLTPLTPDWNAGYRYGYGIFRVIVQLPADWDTFVGSLGGEERRIATFTLTEV